MVNTLEIAVLGIGLIGYALVTVILEALLGMVEAKRAELSNQS